MDKEIQQLFELDRICLDYITIYRTNYTMNDIINGCNYYNKTKKIVNNELKEIKIDTNKSLKELKDIMYEYMITLENSIMSILMEKRNRL